MLGAASLPSLPECARKDPHIPRGLHELLFLLRLPCCCLELTLSSWQ